MMYHLIVSVASEYQCFHMDIIISGATVKDALEIYHLQVSYEF